MTRTRPDLPRYVGVGLLTYVTDLGSLAVLRDVVGLPLSAATAVAFCFAIGVNFGLNSTWTFGPGNYRGANAGRYAALLLVNLGATVLIVDGLARLGVPYPAGKTLAVGITAAWTYWLSRNWVFRPDARSYGDVVDPAPPVT